MQPRPTTIGRSDCIIDYSLRGADARVNNYFAVSFALIAHTPARLCEAINYADP